jgi:hypothetical protein
MRSIFPSVKGLIVLAALAGFQGCGKSGSAPAPEVDAHADEHAHGAGPHGGQIIELGEEEYHAELTHDDATHKVGVYLLDGSAKAAAPIDAPSIVVNCRVEEKPTQFTLMAAPQPGEVAGSSSYFELVSEDLVKAIDDPDSVARLNIVISGKPYVGLIETHGHDHDHDHAHGEEEGHK